VNKRPDAALRALTEARELVERLSSDFPSTDRYHDLSATVLESLAGEIQRDPNRAALARGLLEQALTIRESLVAGLPSSPVYLERLAGTSGRLADSWLDAKSFDQAEHYQRKELSYQSRLHQENPGVPAYRFGRGRALHNLADFLRQRGRAQEALPLEREAVVLLSSVYHENVTDAAYGRAVSYAYWTLAALEIDRKDHRAAAKTVASYLAIEPNGFEEAREAAGFLCRCIVLCRLDQGIPAAERESLARACSDQAITTLQTAVRCGFRDLNELKNSRTYDPLRDRPEFARVVHDVAVFLDAFNDR
jgi:tetratricopeptide (TPR) repeat protein